MCFAGGSSVNREDGFGLRLRSRIANLRRNAQLVPHNPPPFSFATTQALRIIVAHDNVVCRIVADENWQVVEAITNDESGIDHLDHADTIRLHS